MSNGSGSPDFAMVPQATSIDPLKESHEGTRHKGDDFRADLEELARLSGQQPLGDGLYLRTMPDGAIALMKRRGGPYGEITHSVVMTKAQLEAFQVAMFGNTVAAEMAAEQERCGEVGRNG